jgi:hypothetical protein
MTDKEAARFALQLREAERVRAQIAEDKATARAGGAGAGGTSESPPPSALPLSVERPSPPAAAA